MDVLYIKIYKYLLSCGFSPVHRGFKLIADALLIMCRPTYLELGEIYSILAGKYNVSSCCIQKNIKNAIDYASLHCNIDFFTREFEFILKNGTMSCGTFLYFVAEKIRY